MTNGEISREFVEKGWQIRYRGGNSVCSTPSDLDLIVADAPGIPDGEGRVPRPGSPPRYSIAAWPSGGGSSGEPGFVLDLYDAERGVGVRVRRVPTPESAAELLGRYGVEEPEARDALGREAPMVPEAAEC